MTNTVYPVPIRPKTVAFQGWAGANSDLACREMFEDATTIPCKSFEDAIQAVHDRVAEVAMIPIENSVAGRVADMHHLLPQAGLHIVAEHYHRVRHQLMAPSGASRATLSRVHSHIQALDQCRGYLQRHGLEKMVAADTAGAAKQVAEWNDPTQAAIASRLAAEIYGLEILDSDIEDEDHNTTRFVVMADRAVRPAPGYGPVITSFLFEVRSVPAALYKALGGFATNGINMTKLESYLVGGRFSQAQFFAEVEAHPDEAPLIRAFEELAFFSRNFRVLGVYPAHPFRRDPSQQDGAA